MNNTKKLIFLTFAGMILSACSSSREEPVGLGGGRDQIPSSKCACVKLEIMPPSDIEIYKQHLRNEFGAV